MYQLEYTQPVSTVNRIALCLAVVLAVSGCAITAGSTFTSVVGSDDSDSSSRGTATEDVSGPEYALRVESDPSGADVFLNGRLQGTTPLELESLNPGSYTLLVERDGYYSERRNISISANRGLIVDVELEPIVGFLDIRVAPSGAELRVDGERVDSGIFPVPVGLRRISARLFGYRDREVRVAVVENSTTTVRLQMERAPFELSELSTLRERFNPANPGATGTTAIAFEVTAPGEGRLLVRDVNGTVIREINAGPFDTWDQSLRWNGRNAGGERVPDGVYQLELDLRGNDGRAVTRTVGTVVDSSLVIRYSTIWGASPGLLYAPTLTPLPPGQAQIALQGTGIITVVDEQITTRFPLRFGTRIGLGANTELGLYGGYIAHSDPTDDRFQAGGSVSWSSSPFPVAAAQMRAGFSAGGMYQNGDSTGRIAGPDTQAGATGLFAQIPLSLSLGVLDVVLAPEYRYAAAPVVYGGGSLPMNNWNSIAYLRAGLHAQLGAVSLGASSALRTESLSGGFSLQPPLPAGLELHWILPDSAVALSAYVAGEFDALKDFYIMSGAGIGVLF